MQNLISFNFIDIKDEKFDQAQYFKYTNAKLIGLDDQGEICRKILDMYA